MHKFKIFLNFMIINYLLNLCKINKKYQQTNNYLKKNILCKTN